MAIGLNEVQVLLEKYMNTIRHPDLERLVVSELYDLQADGGDETSSSRWPGSYPSTGKAGVYLILDEQQHLLYVGKASWNSCLGARLNTYFKYAPDSSCRIVHNWSSQPRYVCVIAVEREFAFEAAALEEYLICRLPECPPDNTIGQARVARTKGEPELES